MPSEKLPRYIPINEVQSDVASINIPFPANTCDPSTIAIDVQRLETLCRIAGIEQLTIRGSYDESNFKTHILGVNRDGSAIAGGATARTEAIAESAKNRQGLFKCSQRIKTNIELDMRELSAHIARSYPGGTRSSQAWATELNKIIKREIKNEGAAFLLSTRAADIGCDLTMLLGVATTIFRFIVSRKYELNLGHYDNLSLGGAVFFLVACMQLCAMPFMINPGKMQIDWEPGTNRRYSPFSFLGSELDRALLLMGMILATRDLIAAKFDIR